MKTIELLNPPPSLEAVLELAAKEAGVMLTKSGQPVAQVIPMAQPARQRIAPLHPGAIEASDDFDAPQPRKLGLHPGAWVVSDDFDEPLPDEFWLGKVGVVPHSGHILTFDN